MKFHLLVFTALVLCVSTGCKRKGPPIALADKMDKAMTLISRSEHTRLVALLIEPEMLARLTADTDMEKFVIEFVGKDKDIQLLQVLRSARQQKPTIIDNKSRAVFELDTTAKEAYGGKEQMIFFRSKGEWYLEI